jgi:hypothetical protein
VKCVQQPVVGPAWQAGGAHQAGDTQEIPTDQHADHDHGKPAKSGGPREGRPQAPQNIGNKIPKLTIIRRRCILHDFSFSLDLIFP